ncbi:undecaprenyl diphosphate synthase family protein, partial [Streptococcus pseudopneumoniae]
CHFFFTSLNYGGRAEITQALKLISQDVLDAKINPGDITEELIGNYLFTQHLPKDLRDPDLIIRTSGELRLSNFLPWQGAYSEL